MSGGAAPRGARVSRRRGAGPLVVALLAATTLQGCLVYSAASTAVSVTGKVIETGVDIILAPVDLIVGDDD